MQLSTQDFLKKALLDTQEQVRDFMFYSEHTDNPVLKKQFKTFAQEQGVQAQQMETFLRNIEKH